MIHASSIRALMLAAAILAVAVANPAATRPARGAGAPAGAGAADTDARDVGAAEELRKMQGEWRSHLLEEEHRAGAKVIRMGIATPVRIVVEGDQLRFREREKDKWSWVATIKIDAAAQPRRITLTRVKKGPPGGDQKTTVEQAIYRWSADGKRLELHSGLDQAAAPRKFLVAGRPEKELDGCIWSMFRPDADKKDH